MADVELTDDDERFRRDVARWLTDHVVGEYAELRGRGGPGDEDVGFDVRVAWERELGEAGFIGLGWPYSSRFFQTEILHAIQAVPRPRLAGETGL